MTNKEEFSEQKAQEIYILSLVESIVRGTLPKPLFDLIKSIGFPLRDPVLELIESNRITWEDFEIWKSQVEKQNKNRKKRTDQQVYDVCLDLAEEIIKDKLCNEKSDLLKGIGFQMHIFAAQLLADQRITMDQLTKYKNNELKKHHKFIDYLLKDGHITQSEAEKYNLRERTPTTMKELKDRGLIEPPRTCFFKEEE